MPRYVLVRHPQRLAYRPKGRMATPRPEQAREKCVQCLVIAPKAQRCVALHDGRGVESTHVRPRVEAARRYVCRAPPAALPRCRRFPLGRAFCDISDFHVWKFWIALLAIDFAQRSQDFRGAESTRTQGARVARQSHITHAFPDERSIVEGRRLPTHAAALRRPAPGAV